MKNTWKLAPLFVLALVMVGCGGGGSASAEGVGESVLSAIQKEDFPSIYRQFDPWTEAALQQQLDREKFRSETTKDWWKNNKDTLASGGDNSLDPGKKLEITDSEGYFGLKPAQRKALKDDWYLKSHKWEKFSDRMEDLRLVDVSVRHGLEGDAGGNVTYKNRYGDTLSVSVTRIGGVWYADGVELSGPEKLPTAE